MFKGGGGWSDRHWRESSHKFLSFLLLLFIGGIARSTSPSITLCMPRATLSALLGGVKLVLGQCEIGTDHNRVAAGQVSVWKRYVCHWLLFSIFFSLSLFRGLTWETGETVRSSRSCPASTLDKAQKWAQCPDPPWTRQYVCKKNWLFYWLPRNATTKA